MAMLKVYKCSMNSCKTFTPAGKCIEFISGRHVTDDEDVVEYMEAQIKAKHPLFYVDANEKEVDGEKLDPLEMVRRKAVEDYIKQQAAKVGMDAGNSTGDAKAGIATSETVAAVAAESLTSKIKVGPTSK